METDPSVEEYPEEILHSSKQNQMPQQFPKPRSLNKLEIHCIKQDCS